MTPTKQSAPLASEEDALAAARSEDPSKVGGAYVDGRRVEGPEPDYGFVVDGQGKRVPAGPDGKPRQPKE